MTLVRDLPQNLIALVFIYLLSSLFYVLSLLKKRLQKNKVKRKGSKSHLILARVYQNVIAEGVKSRAKNKASIEAAKRF